MEGLYPVREVVTGCVGSDRVGQEVAEGGSATAEEGAEQESRPYSVDGSGQQVQKHGARHSEGLLEDVGRGEEKENVGRMVYLETAQGFGG